MNDLQQELRDIAGFDQLSNWPPAPIWWILLAIILIIMIIVIVRVYQKILYKRSWEYDASSQLLELEQNLNQKNSHESLIELSQLIKRIIIQKYGRKTCASLAGNKLLSWLKEKDPNNFDWKLHGAIIGEKIYAPTDNEINLNQIKKIISAIRQWVTYPSLTKHKKNRN